ncbi:OmpA family protein [Litoreibacter ponti]|uniref:OmpA family protein n=1 Tax=Litoreibacter ponti TaxID=1510457 RepID=A0A2T6BN74_9RHOB|nr:OmpA family protein [Litoreibacter ponti]PTX57484.1 OmpA family protein [Litoreibacter ponti]
MFRNDSARYRREGLSLMQAKRLAEGPPDASAKYLIAGLAIVATGCLAYLGAQHAASTLASDRVAIAELDTTPSAALDTPAPAITVDAPVAATDTQTADAGDLIAALTVAPQVPLVPEAESTTSAPLLDTSIPAPETVSVETAEVTIDTTSPSLEPQVPVAEVEPVAEQVAEQPVAPDEGLEVAALDSDVPQDDAAQDPALSCVAELRQAARESTIYFNVGSAQLTGADLARISRVGRLAETCPGTVVQVTGHSDSTGNDLINLDLSWQRADNTVTALAQIGVDTSNMEPVGFGARAPLSQGDASDEDRNRRVEFIVLKKTEGN